MKSNKNTPRAYSPEELAKDLLEYFKKQKYGTVIKNLTRLQVRWMAESGYTQ